MRAKSQILNAPRVMIAATKSGSGKTTFVCALLRLLQNCGKNPVSFKCGPDFIDPMFHERVLRINCANLDSYFSGGGEIKSILARNFLCSDADCSVIEGVMGFFDGLAGTSLRASSYDIAGITKTPVILCVDAQGMSRSSVALVKGFLEYDKTVSNSKESLIKGIFLNKVSRPQFVLLKKMIEEECGVKVLGFLPNLPEFAWKNRHLGLFLPSEIADLNEQIQKTAEILAGNLDFKVLEEIMNGAEDFEFFEDSPAEKPRPVKIAVARDEAFCFYYHENIRLLEEAGAQIEYFSPLHDSSLPDGARGILLGGGYPELCASELQANSSMRLSIKKAIENGVPVIAECGGFMYLQEKITVESGEIYEMCGAIEGECFFTGKLVRFGYGEFFKKTEENFSVKGHEFHYFDSTNNGLAFTARKALSDRSWDCMIHTEKILAGFPHLYYRSNPEILRRFVESCRNYGGR